MFTALDVLAERAVDQLHAGVAPEGDARIVAVAPNVATKSVRLFDHGSAGHVTGVFGLLALPFVAVRAMFGRRSAKDQSVAEQAQYNNVMLVFRESQLDVYDGPQTLFGDLLESHGYSEASYGRPANGLAVKTELHVGASTYVIDGRYERDLRSLLAPLGVSIAPIS